MKTWILDTPDSPVNASGRVLGVVPIKASLPDEKPSLEALLSDCEALNDEVAELNEVARRAQRREFEAVKRCEAMREALLRARDHLIMSEGCFVIDGKVGQSSDWKDALQQVRTALKGQP